MSGNVLHIFEYLDWPSRLKLSSTCIFFQDLLESKSLWYSVRWVEKVMPEKMINSIERHNSEVEVLRCNSREEESILSSNFNKLLWKLPNLKCVNLFNYMILYEVNWFQNASGITCLIVSGCDNMSGFTFVNALKFLVHLRYLEAMYCCHRLVALDIITAVQNCKKLEVLNVFHTGNMRPWMVVLILKKCPLIRQFIFSSLHRNDTQQECVQWYKIVRRHFKAVEFGRELVERLEDYEEFNPHVSLVKWIDYLNDNSI